MEKRNKKNSGKDNSNLFKFLKKIPFPVFIFVGLIFSLVSVYLISKFNHNLLSIIFYTSMQCLNFALIGFSLRLKSPKAMKLMFFGASDFVLSFIALYITDVYRNNLTIFNTLGAFISLNTLSGTFLFLMALRRAILK